MFHPLQVQKNVSAAVNEHVPTLVLSQHNSTIELFLMDVMTYHHPQLLMQQLGIL